MTKDEFNKQFKYVEEILIRIAKSFSTNVEKDIQNKIFQIKHRKEYTERVIGALIGTFEDWNPHLKN